MPATIPKKDIIAAPQLYSSGMSYPGFVMISEQNLLFDPKTSPIVYQETIAAVVAHEMAHHWFGNIVIAKWWSDLWLIEGIVKHLTEMALRDVYPNWHFARLQTTNDVMEVFYGDSMQSSTAVSRVQFLSYFFFFCVKRSN